MFLLHFYLWRILGWLLFLGDWLLNIFFFLELSLWWIWFTILSLCLLWAYVLWTQGGSTSFQLWKHGTPHPQLQEVSPQVRGSRARLLRKNTRSLSKSRQKNHKATLQWDTFPKNCLLFRLSNWIGFLYHCLLSLLTIWPWSPIM